jgi:hypothetical protein
MNYAREKTQDLLDAGVRRVIWYTTFDKKVMVAEKGKRKKEKSGLLQAGMKKWNLLTV